MRVLVTGGCGFIGTALVLRLLSDGHQVLNVDKCGRVSNAALDAQRTPHYQLFRTDLSIANAQLAQVVEQFKPEWVFHLAAETHVDNSISQPVVSVQTNVMSTVHLLDVLTGFQRAHPGLLASVVMVSTDEVYGDVVDQLGAEAFAETQLLLPSSPYSASKAAADHLALAWLRTFGLPVLVSRCSNNYGPWQFPEKLIPRVISRALSNDVIPLYGDGLQQREWLHVEDHVSALLLLAKSGTIGEIYNIGSEVRVTNFELVSRLCQLLNQRCPSHIDYTGLIQRVADRPGHDRGYAINSDKIAALGWQASMPLTQGLAATVDWFLAHPHWLGATSH